MNAPEIEEMCNSELKDDHINAYMGMLTRQFAKTGILCLETWFLTDLMAKYKNGELEKDRKKHAFFNRLTVLGRLPRRIILPYNACRLHWVLVCILPHTHHIISIDPLDSKNAVLNREYTPVFEEITILFTLLLSYVFEACTVNEWNYVFRARSPWVLCRSYQKHPQQDTISCGFYTLMCARICSDTSSDSHLFAFSIDSIETKKPHIALEIKGDRLKSVDSKFQTVLDLKGMRQTANLKIMNNIRRDTCLFRVRCVIDPYSLFHPVRPDSMIPNAMDVDLNKESMMALSRCPAGYPFTFTLENLTKRCKSPMTAMCMLSVLSNCLRWNKQMIKKQKLSKLCILVCSDLIFETLAENGPVVSLRLILESNGISFQQDEETRSTFVLGLNDILASYVHNLCESVPVSITCIREVCCNKTVNVEEHIETEHHYSIITT
jgi:hypothetical protein